jgi:hypothetical protein
LLDRKFESANGTILGVDQFLLRNPGSATGEMSGTFHPGEKNDGSVYRSAEFISVESEDPGFGLFRFGTAQSFDRNVGSEYEVVTGVTFQSGERNEGSDIYPGLKDPDAADTTPDIPHIRIPARMIYRIVFNCISSLYIPVHKISSYQTPVIPGETENANVYSFTSSILVVIRIVRYSIMCLPGAFHGATIIEKDL